MDHHFHVGASAVVEGFDDKYVKGRRPNGIYIPRFELLKTPMNLKNTNRHLPHHISASSNFWNALHSTFYQTSIPYPMFRAWKNAPQSGVFE